MEVRGPAAKCFRGIHLGRRPVVILTRRRGRATTDRETVRTDVGRERERERTEMVD